MSEKQTINDLMLEVAKLRKDNEYLTGEVAYWKQQAWRDDSVSDECDTREKLEADVEGICWGKNDDRYMSQKRYLSSAGIEVDEGNVMANHEGHVLMTVIMHLLDRQAAITTQECTDVYVSGCEACRRAQKREIAELQEKIDALEADKTRAECQKDSDNSADWEDSCDTREILEHDCKWMAHAWAPDDFPDDKLEKKLYREIIDKLDRQAEITRAECEAEMEVR